MFSLRKNSPRFDGVHEVCFGERAVCLKSVGVSDNRMPYLHGMPPTPHHSSSPNCLHKMLSEVGKWWRLC
jgi:hypothetical protein